MTETNDAMAELFSSGERMCHGFKVVHADMIIIILFHYIFSAVQTLLVKEEVHDVTKCLEVKECLINEIIMPNKLHH